MTNESGPERHNHGSGITKHLVATTHRTRIHAQTLHKDVGKLGTNHDTWITRSCEEMQVRHLAARWLDQRKIPGGEGEKKTPRLTVRIFE